MGTAVSQLYKLNTVKELVKLFDRVEEFKLYGAGYYLHLFLEGLETINIDYQTKATCILVSDANNNPEKIANIPVMSYQNADLKPDDYIVLTLGHRYTDEVYKLLQNTGVNLVQMDFNMFQEAAYREVKQSIQPFMEQFPEKVSELNSPVASTQIMAWTCWWQGEEQAPDIVKACIESQKKYVPGGVKHIVITEKNVEDYIILPAYILEKVKAGDITLTTLSDMIRSALLYKYGGFWMDSTLMVLNPLDKEILNYSLYTRNLPETQYCSNAMWAGWFLYAKPGNKLFQFLMEGFFIIFPCMTK